MNIQFKTVHYELTDDDQSIFEKKLGALSKYSGNDGKELYLHVTLGKDTEAHQHGGIWFAEGKVSIDGESFFAKDTKESLRDAVDGIFAQLGREMRRAKNRRTSLVRRGGAKLKNLFRR